ncbi:MAG: hypothetical protein DSY80_01040 [Desulfocapsa sp.]|nr:MAG: hypothetical protein DSY80_01040 [Desulfocapsa sp.]
MIIPQVLEQVRVYLQASMIDDLLIDDPTRASAVKLGKSNLTQERIVVALTGGDPDDLKYRDHIVSAEKDSVIGWGMYPREIGGGEAWYRRCIAILECQFINEQITETQAMQYAYTVQGRLMDGIQQVNVIGLVDEYEERAIKIFLAGSQFHETGGRRGYAWKGKVFWHVLTERV